MPDLIRSGREQSQADKARAAARAQSVLQSADVYIRAVISGNNFQMQQFSPDEIADFAIKTAEALLSKWELAVHPIEGEEQ